MFQHKGKPFDGGWGGEVKIKQHGRNNNKIKTLSGGKKEQDNGW